MLRGIAVGRLQKVVFVNERCQAVRLRTARCRTVAGQLVIQHIGKARCKGIHLLLYQLAVRVCRQHRRRIDQRRRQRRKNRADTQHKDH